MNSTEQSHERELRAFFRQYLVPTAEAARKAGRSFFPMGADDAIDSYYRRRDENSSYVFDLDALDVAIQLADLWSDTPELRALVDPLLNLSSTLSNREESSPDVSPFVYAMF